MASAWPILVLLAIHLFVNPRWSSEVGFRIIRWGGVAGVGVLAMIVSWTHLHDLLATRGQGLLVSVSGPVAIDLMAIMATGLILSTRTRQLDIGTSLVSTFVAEDIADVAEDIEDTPWTDTERIVTEAGLSMDISAEASSWLDNLTRSVGSLAPVLPVSVSPAPRTVRPDSVPADAADMIFAWADTTEDKPKGSDVDKLISADMGVSTKTVYRWRKALLPNS